MIPEGNPICLGIDATGFSALGAQLGYAGDQCVHVLFHVACGFLALRLSTRRRERERSFVHAFSKFLQRRISLSTVSLCVVFIMVLFTYGCYYLINLLLNYCMFVSLFSLGTQVVYRHPRASSCYVCVHIYIYICIYTHSYSHSYMILSLSLYIYIYIYYVRYT